MSYRVYFGGTHSESWSEDYRLTVTYSHRPFVEAERRNGEWTVTGGDAALAALIRGSGDASPVKRYFRTAADIQELWSGKREPSECRFTDPFAAPELMRYLMDERGVKAERAYEITLLACADSLPDEAELASFQPRTASLVGLIKKYRRSLTVLMHDSAGEVFRSPRGAIRERDALRITARLVSGAAENVTLVLWGTELEKELPMERSGDEFSVTVPGELPAGAYNYAFRVRTGESEIWLTCASGGHVGFMSDGRGEGFRLTVYLRGFDTPAWFRRSVMYQIFPDRFGFSDDGTFERGIAYHRALGQTPETHLSLDEPVKYTPRPGEKDYIPDDFYGGSFKGIENRLPYLKNLGISCVYLNPIAEARSNHRYDTSDYFRPDPILGTEEDFEHLCAEAEKLGIRMILDGVFSHTGADSVYFNRYGHYPAAGACQGEESEYYGWYSFKSFPDDYKCWWGFSELPEVDELDPGWQERIVSGNNSAVKTWLRRGASGWRLDVADELPDEVLSLIRASAKAEKPDAPIIGEVWEDAVTKVSYGKPRNYALGYSLDSVMNYPLRAAVLDFARFRLSAYELRDFLISQRMNYPAPLYYSLMNLLGSHDVERLRSALATDVTIRSLSREAQLELEFSPEALEKAVALEKLCAAIQFALPGVPSIYYGDEQGMTGVCDPFNRAPFKDAGHELYDYYASLARLRGERPELSTGEISISAPNRDVLIITRTVEGGHDVFGAPAADGTTVIAVNRSDGDYRDALLSIPPLGVTIL